MNHFSEPIGLSDGNQKPHLEDRLANQEASPVPPTATMLILSFVPIFLGLGFLYIVLGAWLVTVGALPRYWSSRLQRISRISYPRA